MFQQIRLAAAVAGIAAVSFTTTTVSAAETPSMQAHSVKVDYSDLDLTSKHDAREMLDRLDRAAARVCGGNELLHPAYKTYSGRVTRAFEACREDALSRAVATVDARELWYVFGAQ